MSRTVAGRCSGCGAPTTEPGLCERCVWRVTMKRQVAGSGEQRIEHRITYSYGVNRDQRRSGFTSFDSLLELVERETMGLVDVTKREARTVTYSDWEEEGVKP